MRLVITAFVIILICTLTAVAQAEAAAPDHMTISGKSWMVANGVDTSAITVKVYDAADNPIPVANVNFQVTFPWTLSVMSGVTDSFGTLTTVLQPTTKSGAAYITVNASVLEGGVLKSIEQVYMQNIDHSTPAIASPAYDLNVSVGGSATINVKVTDAFGNSVDNRNVVETVQFTASGSDDSGFWDGSSYVKMLTVPVDSDGIAEATYIVTNAGPNYVDIQPPAPIFHRLITITGVNNGLPYSINQVVSPGGYPYPYTKTDGSKFTFVYTLLDQYGNPAGNRGIQITTNVPGEQTTIMTNSNGIAAFFYQKDTVGLYTLTATAVDNATVTCSQTVEFIAANPTTMLLTANPQTMPSLDVKPSATSSVMAKVIDAMGNPVEGELVRFWIKSYSYGGFNQTIPSSLTNDSRITSTVGEILTGVTDNDGYATITFSPGAFTTNRSDPKYSYNAEGNTIVEAVWQATDHTIQIEYMNYPFLSVATSVSPQTLTVNDTVNVSILLRGDGWALEPLPIDVILLTDRSGSMLYNETLDTWTSPDTITSQSPDDRMVMAMNAGKTFVGQMSTQDRIGLVSFADLSDYGGYAILYDTGNWTTHNYIYDSGWRAGRDYYINGYGRGLAYSTDDVSYVTTHYPGHGTQGRKYGSAMATIDLPLTYDQSTVKTIIGKMVPAGGTPMRYGLYTAVKQMINDPLIVAHKRDNAVKAIVLLTDGEWNTGGDPEGGWGADSYSEIGTGSVIAWAKANNIKIFAIGLGNDADQTELASYASQTGGKSYMATTGLDLNSIYTDIAGELHTEAGVGTTMDLAFHNIQVNGASFPGAQVVKYACIPPVSTHEFSYNQTDPSIIDKFLDQSAEWNAGQTLSFDIGTMFLGQVWLGNFSMKILQNGNIKILDSSSTINFNDGTVLPLPDTYITAVPDNPNSGLTPFGIWVTDVRRTDTGSSPDSVDVAWNLTYTGLESSIREDIDILQDGTTDWSHRLTKYVDRSTTQDAVTLDISGLPSGTWYVRITVQADDAGEDAGATQFAIQKGAEGTPKIKIL
jgi:hypothetical protein